MRNETDKMNTVDVSNVKSAVSDRQTNQLFTEETEGVLFSRFVRE